MWKSMERYDCSIIRLPSRNLPEETKKTCKDLAYQNPAQVKIVTKLCSCHFLLRDISQVILQHNFEKCWSLTPACHLPFIVGYNLYQCHLLEVIRFTSNFTNCMNEFQKLIFHIHTIHSPIKPTVIVLWNVSTYPTNYMLSRSARSITLPWT